MTKQSQAGVDVEAVSSIFDSKMAGWLKQAGAPADSQPKDSDPQLIAAVKSMFAGGGEKDYGASHLRVKSPSEAYSTHRYPAKHHRTGETIFYRGSPVESPSQKEQALIGVWLKAMLGSRSPTGQRLSEHEQTLLKELVSDQPWCGLMGGIVQDDVHLPSLGQQAAYKATVLIDDTVSGGQYLIPKVFDQALVTTIQLHSELFPFVDVVDIARGSSIEGAKIASITPTWNVGDGSTLTLLTTDSLISQITATVFPLTVGIQIGLDFLNDSVVNITNFLLEQTSENFAAELDKVIAIGDGTSQPQGLKNASGTTAVNSANNTPGPVKIDDLLTLYFGLGVQYRKRLQASFVMNDTNYKRFRSLATGVTGDTRLTLGMDVGSYSLFDTPARINNSIANSMAFYVALKKYRMWRAAGFEVRQSAEGKTLMTQNSLLLVIRGRFAGKLVDGAACAKMADLDA